MSENRDLERLEQEPDWASLPGAPVDHDEPAKPGRKAPLKKLPKGYRTGDGILRRKREDGTTAYQVRLKQSGERKAKTFDTLAEARRYKAKRTLSPEPTNLTCAEYAERWLQPKPGWRASTVRSHGYSLAPFIAEYGSRSLSDIDRAEARAFARRQNRRRTVEVARAMFSEAVEDGYVTGNPFARLGLEQSRGRKDEEVMTEQELHLLADTALSVHGPEYGPVFRAAILFSGYVGLRKGELLGLEWHDLDLHKGTVTVERQVDKYGTTSDTKTGTRRVVVVPKEARQAVIQMPRRPELIRVFPSKRWRPLRAPAHQSLWNPVRSAWLAQLPDERRERLSVTDWHSLRHFCGHWFYIVQGLGSELAAHQLGHSTPRLIESTYGHWRQSALERTLEALRPKVEPIRAVGVEEETG